MSSSNSNLAVPPAVLGRKRSLAETTTTTTTTGTTTCCSDDTRSGEGASSSVGEPEQEEQPQHQDRGVGVRDGGDGGSSSDRDDSTAAGGRMDRSVQQLPTTLDRLRLEAIFYPKFENESSERVIRNQMITNVQQQLGYLEVSLKHSGSLVLWSGGTDRFYSKNATANQYSYLGQVLLLRHFLRVQHANVHDNSNKNHDIVQAALEQFHTCGKYLAQHRLTASFEVVVGGGLGGDHGQRPRHDYLILTAVADRINEGFYSTAQLVTLAHRFGLPHNDYFLFERDDNNNNNNNNDTNPMLDVVVVNGGGGNGAGDSSAAVAAGTSTEPTPTTLLRHRLFDLYDTLRATGLASTVVPALEQAATLHLPSMYPHLEYQGDILEGIVVRYVPLSTASELEELRQFRPKALEYQTRLAETPPFPELVKQLQQTHQNLPPVFTTDLRALAVPPNPTPPDSKSFEANSVSTTLSDQLQEILELSHSVTRVATVRGTGTAAGGTPPQPLIARVTSLVSSPDEETRRIATLLQTLDTKIKASDVDYGLFVRSTLPERPADRPSNPPGAGRSCWWMVVHIRQDAVFAKFEKLRQPNEMKLFRGFVVELVESSTSRSSTDDSTAAAVQSSATLTTETTGLHTMTLHEDDPRGGSDCATTSHAAQQQKQPPPLMLKLKLLPYMVRTFGCRNGLHIVRRNGPSAFLKYTDNLLHKWEMPVGTTEQWQPYFRAWAMYLSQMDGGNARKHAVTAASYLSCLEEFDELYRQGKLPSAMEVENDGLEALFGGFLVVVASHARTAMAVATVLARELKGKVVEDLETVTPENLLLFRHPGHGAVAAATIVRDLGTMRKLVKSSRDVIGLVFVGCQSAEGCHDFDNEKERKKFVGMLGAWRNVNCSLSLDLPPDVVEDGSADEKSESLLSTIAAIREKYCEIAVAPSKVGVLVFFPGIPGCGKSSLLDADTLKSIRESLDQLDQTCPRKLSVLSGDKVQGRYWPLAIRKRLDDPSGVLITDKNSPYPAWDVVASATSKSKSVGVAVTFPSILETTAITGSRNLNGNLLHNGDEQVYPFHLKFLAICMMRVLNREVGSHDGRLDCGTARACLIVVKFYSLYRGVASDDFERRLTSYFENEGALLAGSPIPLPFLKDPARSDDLPIDLRDILVEAIQVQVGTNRSNVSFGSLFTQRILTVFFLPYHRLVSTWVGRMRQKWHRHTWITLKLDFARACIAIGIISFS